MPSIDERISTLTEELKELLKNIIRL